MIYVCLNGEFIKMNDATVSANQSGLFYGAGCFETMLYTSADIQYWEKHVNRLCGGLSWLGIPANRLPDAEVLNMNVRKLLKHNRIEDISCKIRIQCSVENEQGYSVNEAPEYFTLITTSELPVRDKKYTLKISNTRTIPSESRPSHLKLSNMLHFREAFRNARRSGFQDALMLNSEKFVAETSIANIFWITGNTVYTPSAACDILPGIIRNEVINFLRKELKLNVEEGRYRSDDLLQSDAVWITNSLMLAKPVEQIDQISFKRDHPVVDKVIEYFSKS